MKTNESGWIEQTEEEYERDGPVCQIVSTQFIEKIRREVEEEEKQKERDTLNLKNIACQPVDLVRSGTNLSLCYSSPENAAKRETQGDYNYLFGPMSPSTETQVVMTTRKGILGVASDIKQGLCPDGRRIPVNVIPYNPDNFLFYRQEALRERERRSG